MSFWTAAFSLVRRASSFSLSTSSSMGMKILALSVTTVTASGISILSAISTDAAEASLSKKSFPCSNTAPSAVSMCRAAFFEGGTFISARRFLMPRIAAIIFSNCFSSASNVSFSSYCGNTDKIHGTSLSETADQISSVTNGIKGCRSFSIPCITHTRTACAAAAVSPPAAIRGFVSSIYQSQ